MPWTLSFLLAASATATAAPPSPESVLGFRPGADRQLADWTQIVDYFRRLDAASDRVRVEEVGRTTEDRPFLVAVMIAGSAAFATPFGYQTNALVYQMGGYNYLDFVKIGIPLNLITWFAAVAAIQHYFPF